MRRGLFIVAVVAALVVVPAAFALLSQHGVKATGLYEQLPAAETDGTTQYSRGPRTRARTGTTSTPSSRGPATRG